MANFEIALKNTLGNEDNPNTNKDDYISANEDKKGGETYKGISRVYHPEWAAWKIIDKCKIYGGFPGMLAGMSDLQDDVKWLYRHEYWNAIKGDLIESQRVANKFFDAVVNPGLIAIKFMQRSLGEVWAKGALVRPIVLAVDGVVGNNTINLINNSNDDELLNEFKSHLVDYYNTHSNPKYIDGWLARAKRG